LAVIESEAQREVRERYQVPDAFRLQVSPGEVLAFLPAHEEAVRAVAEGFERLPIARRAGRAALRRVDASAGLLLAREYRKGGLLRALRGRRFRGRWRPLDELGLCRRLLALGVPVVEVVGAVLRLSAGGWRGFLLSREVEGGEDLAEWLHAGAPEPERRTVLLVAGRAVRRLHDAGVAHADLHPKNLLLAPGGAILVLDLDRARAHDGSLPDGERLGNLVRLARAVEKHRLKGLRFSSRDGLRFLEGYAGGRRAAVEWFRRVSSRLSRGLRLRRVWWRLLGEARPYLPAESRT
jgi:3-deoxy-D-manno-octulosonic acid kinase